MKMYKNTYNKVIDVKTDIDSLIECSRSKLTKKAIQHMRIRSYKKMIKNITNNLYMKDGLIHEETVDICEFIYKVIGETKIIYKNTTYHITSNGGKFELMINNGMIYRYIVDTGTNLTKIINPTTMYEKYTIYGEDKEVLVEAVETMLKYYLLEDWRLG